ncbi:HeH/LEM domain protein [compost metagenome]
MSDRCAVVAVEHLGVAEYLDRQRGPGLREDGPTVSQWLEAGYLAVNYPPEGYASRSSQEEVDAAILLEKGAEDETDPLKMTVPKLKEWLTAKNIAFEAGMPKPALQALVPKND